MGQPVHRCRALTASCAGPRRCRSGRRRWRGSRRGPAACRRPPEGAQPKGSHRVLAVSCFLGGECQLSCVTGHGGWNLHKQAWLFASTRQLACALSGQLPCVLSACQAMQGRGSPRIKEPATSSACGSTMGSVHWCAPPCSVGCRKSRRGWPRPSHTRWGWPVARWQTAAVGEAERGVAVKAQGFRGSGWWLACWAPVVPSWKHSTPPK